MQSSPQPLATTGPLKRRWWFLGAASRDEIDVFPSEVVVHQRTIGGGQVHIPLEQLTEYRFQGNRLYLRAGAKKYVLRRIRRDEADAIIAAISAARHH